MRQTKGFLVFVLCCFIVSFLSTDSLAAKKRIKKRYSLTARSAILSNSTQVTRLFGKNVDTKVWPASTTKVMTALLVLERLPLDREVVVSQRAVNVQPTKAGLSAGEHYKVSELLYASLMQSANDASVALAEAVAGSEAEFVRLMNQRAKKLGASHTLFRNANGLPTKERQYTTAYDMYLIFREALKYPLFKEALRNKNKIITSREGRNITLKNYNKLLWKNWNKKVYGKTGYTRKALFCFVGYLENGKDTVIIAVFGCRKRWQDIQYLLTRFGKVKL